MSVDVTAIYTAFKTHLETEIPGIAVSRANINDVSPTPPHATMFLNPITKVHQDWNPQPVDENDISILGQRNFTMQLQFFADYDSLSYASLIQDSFSKRSVIDFFLGEKISILEELAINDLTTVFGTGWDRRAALDLNCQTTTVITDNHGLIERVQLTSAKVVDETGATIRDDSYEISI